MPSYFTRLNVYLVEVSLGVRDKGPYLVSSCDIRRAKPTVVSDPLQGDAILRLKSEHQFNQVFKLAAELPRFSARLQHNRVVLWSFKLKQKAPDEDNKALGMFQHIKECANEHTEQEF